MGESIRAYEQADACSHGKKREVLMWRGLTTTEAIILSFSSGPMHESIRAHDHGSGRSRCGDSSQNSTQERYLLASWRQI